MLTQQIMSLIFIYKLMCFLPQYNDLSQIHTYGLISDLPHITKSHCVTLKRKNTFKKMVLFYSNSRKHLIFINDDTRAHGFRLDRLYIVLTIRFSIYQILSANYTK